MKTFLISAAIATTAIAAVPAAAQYHQGGPGWNQPQRGGPNQYRPGPRGAERQLQQGLNRVENQLQRATQRRTIHPREAVQFRREANQIRQQLNRFSRGGLSQWQAQELNQAIRHLEQRVRYAERRR